MIERLLIANRGEIACRIIRTANRLGIETVAVFSDADANSLHVRMADFAVHIGPSAASESYLVGENIIAAARRTGADAIHPGFGFLSENAQFAQDVIDADLIWVGPDPAAIEAMGLKNAAKSRMQAAGVPVTPGYMGVDQSLDRLIPAADDVGYPVLIKAIAGGGGKGMRKVEHRDDFAAALQSCQREAKSAFGDDRVLIEKLIARPRHIEVQIFGDKHGNVVHLFERDCSLQRRHQKVIEEAPAPGMDEATRAAICDAAVKAAKSISYVGAGTIEFIADASEGLRADRIWFMEMNTRLQVEHPVTEAITGVDLVEWQLRIASGETLPKSQKDIGFSGHAIEARLYAEDPARDFLPSTGQLEVFELPTDLRIETGVAQGDTITPFYDPMIAKLIAYGATRDEAIETLKAACETVAIHPVKTNSSFLARALGTPGFGAADIDTSFIPRHGEALTRSLDPTPQALELTAQSMLPQGQGPWFNLPGFRMNAAPDRTVRMRLNGKVVLAALPSFKVDTDPLPPEPPSPLEGEGPGMRGAQRIDENRRRLGELSAPLIRPLRGHLLPQGEKDRPQQSPRVLLAAPHQTLIAESGEVFAFTPDRTEASHAGAAADGAVTAPIPGRISYLAVTKDQPVKLGETLVVLEAMKMEYTLSAPFDGIVKEVSAAKGDQVAEGAVLVKIVEDHQ